MRNQHSCAGKTVATSKRLAHTILKAWRWNEPHCIASAQYIKHSCYMAIWPFYIIEWHFCLKNYFGKMRD